MPYDYQKRQEMKSASDNESTVAVYDPEEPLAEDIDPEESTLASATQSQLVKEDRQVPDPHWEEFKS